MHWIAAERLTMNQATGIRSIGRVVLDDLTVNGRQVDLIEREPISLVRFVGMIRDPQPMGLDGLPDNRDIHTLPPVEP
jgi:hypothetical protein